MHRRALWCLLAFCWLFVLSVPVRAWEASKIDICPSLSRDGKTLVFQRYDAGAARGDLHFTSGTQLNSIDKYCEQPVVSPDGRYVAWRSESDDDVIYSVFQRLKESPFFGNIYLTSLSTRKTRRLTSGGGTHPFWSPGGSRVGYITPRGQLMSIDIHAKKVRLLARKMITAEKMTWLPSGPAVSVARGRQVAWYAIRRNGTLKRLTRPLTLPPNPWPRGGKALIDWTLSRDGQTMICVREKVADTVNRSIFRVSVVNRKKSHDFAALTNFFPKIAAPGKVNLMVALAVDERHFVVSVEGGICQGDLKTGKFIRVTEPYH